MSAVLALLVLALSFAGIGLFVEAAEWALIVAGGYLAAGLLTGYLTRGPP